VAFIDVRGNLCATYSVASLGILGVGVVEIQGEMLVQAKKMGTF
jgi:hypothetical protein